MWYDSIVDYGQKGYGLKNIIGMAKKSTFKQL